MAGPNKEESSQPTGAGETDTLHELRKFKSIIEILPDPVFVTDESGYLIYTNQAFNDRFGYGTPKDKKLHLSDFLSGGDIDRIIDFLQDIIMGEPKERPDRRMEVTATTQNGRQRKFSTAVVPFATDGEFSGAAAMLRDVTLRKRRNDVFTVMDRALRHNLRTNVNIIAGFTDNLRSQLGDEHEKTLTRIRDAAQWLYKLGDSLRTLQVTIDESFESNETRSISNIVDEAVEAGRNVDHHADISAHVSAQGELQAGSPVLYALENIVENAIVHNDAENPTVKIWIAHAPHDGWIDIHIEDNGPGIPQMERDIVIGESSVDQLQHGSGLGLWITRWVVEIFDGELKIEDNVPRGSVVTLRLPLAVYPVD